MRSPTLASAFACSAAWAALLVARCRRRRCVLVASTPSWLADGLADGLLDRPVRPPNSGRKPQGEAASAEIVPIVCRNRLLRGDPLGPFACCLAAAREAMAATGSWEGRGRGHVQNAQLSPVFCIPSRVGGAVAPRP